MAVRRDKTRGEKIPIDVLAKVQGTDLDTGTYLDKLKKLAHDEQREKVDQDQPADHQLHGAATFAISYFFAILSCEQTSLR